MRMMSVVVTLAIVSPLWADTPPKDIVTRAVQMHGGADALAKTKAMIQRAEGVVNFQGQQVNAKRIGKWELPNRVFSDIEFDQQGKKVKFQLVLNGLNGWQRGQDGPPTEVSAGAYDLLIDEAHVQWLCTIAPLEGKGLKLANAPAANVTGQACEVIIVSQPNKPDTAMYFSKATGLLVKVAFKGRSPGGPQEKELIFSDHKQNSGIMLPMRIEDFQQGKRMGEWKVTEYQFVDKFEAGTFKKP